MKPNTVVLLVESETKARERIRWLGVVDRMLAMKSPWRLQTLQGVGRVEGQLKILTCKGMKVVPCLPSHLSEHMGKSVKTNKRCP